MTIEFNKNDGNLNVLIDGRLDTYTSPDFEMFLEENYEAGQIVINCEKLAYVSSAGLRVLLGAHKKTKGAMKLINVSEVVMEVLEMTAFAEIFVIE